MIERYLPEEEKSLIRDALGRDESYDDLLTMGEIIAETRLDYRPSSSKLKQARFAFITLCAISWPGKPPTYRAEVKKLRRAFRGISEDDVLKEHFKSRLSRDLISVESYEHLNFHDITSIFHPGVPTTRSAVMSVGAGERSDIYEDEDESDDDQNLAGSNK